MRALIYMKASVATDRCVACDGDFSAFVRASLLFYEQRHPTLVKETEQVELVDLVTRINQLDESTLIKTYIQHLCPCMLAASQMSSKAALHDTIRYIKTSCSTKVALSCRDDYVTVMISDVRSDSEGSLQRDIEMFHRFLSLLYGPCDYLLDTIHVVVKKRLRSELAQIFKSYLSLKAVDQTMWFDAIESIHLGDDARLQVTKSLKNVLKIINEKAKSAQLLSGASKSTAEVALSHTVLLVDTKVGWLTSQQGAQDLAKSDLVLLTILAKNAFSGCSSANYETQMTLDNFSATDSKNKSIFRLGGKPASLFGRTNTFDQPQLRRVHATVDCMSRPHSQPPGGRSAALILDANTNSRIALTIPRTAADRVRDGPTEPDSVSSTLANWNIVDNDNASSQLDPSASSGTNEQEQLEGDSLKRKRENGTEKAGEIAANEVHFKPSLKPRPHSYQNANSLTTFETQVGNESERKVYEKVRILGTFVYRRVVQLQTLDCAYVPHEAYFLRVDASITLILLFRLANYQLASSIYACAQLLARMRLAQADVEQLLERSSAAGTNPNLSMSLHSQAAFTSIDSISSNTARNTIQGAAMRSRIESEPNNLSGLFQNGFLAGLSNTETIADAELPVEARNGLIREFEKAWKSVCTFARGLKPKRERRQDFGMAHHFDNRDLRTECLPQTLTERWEQVKVEFYQRFYASGKTSDRETFSGHIEKLNESLRYVFQLAYLGEWAHSSEESVAIRVRRSDAYAPLFDIVLYTIRADLSFMLDFLRVRAQSNICVTSYIENYQGLVFFGFVNRTTSHRISTSITIEPVANDREKDGRYDEHGYVRCTARRKDQIMNAINWYRDTLNATGARTNFGMMTRHGFKFTFYRFLEDANATPVEAESAEYDRNLKRALENPRWAIARGIHVKEFFSVHLSTVQSGKIVDHIRKILLNRNVELQV